jgi:hypothetical protein
MMAGIESNLIRIEDSQAPVYRLERLDPVRSMFTEDKLTLIAPHLWDDPFENLLIKCGVEYESAPERGQVFFDSLRKPIFAQCWSHHRESDQIWRAYSTVIKDLTTMRNTSKDTERVQLRTTPGKLLSSLWNASPADPAESCFLGDIRYGTEEKIMQFVANEVGRMGIQAFSDSRGHAESVLFKREAFFGEQEARLVYVDWEGKTSCDTHFTIQLDANELVDEVVLDPRLGEADFRDRVKEIEGWGCTGNIRKSNLYQQKLFQICCP